MSRFSGPAAVREEYLVAPRDPVENRRRFSCAKWTPVAAERGCGLQQRIEVIGRGAEGCHLRDDVGGIAHLQIIVRLLRAVVGSFAVARRRVSAGGEAQRVAKLLTGIAAFAEAEAPEGFDCVSRQ